MKKTLIILIVILVVIILVTILPLCVGEQQQKNEKQQIEETKLFLEESAGVALYKTDDGDWLVENTNDNFWVRVRIVDITGYGEISTRMFPLRPKEKIVLYKNVEEALYIYSMDGGLIGFLRR